VAVDRENGNNLLAFQHLSTRERGSKDGNVVQNIKVEKICDHVLTAEELSRYCCVLVNSSLAIWAVSYFICLGLDLALILIYLYLSF